MEIESKDKKGEKRKKEISEIKGVPRGLPKKEGGSVRQTSALLRLYRPDNRVRIIHYAKNTQKL